MNTYLYMSSYPRIFPVNSQFWLDIVCWLAVISSLVFFRKFWRLNFVSFLLFSAQIYIKIIHFGNWNFVLVTSHNKYSWLPITRTFKGNWKWFELSGVRVIESREKMTGNKEKTVFTDFLFIQLWPVYILNKFNSSIEKPKEKGTIHF